MWNLVYMYVVKHEKLLKIKAISEFFFWLQDIEGAMTASEVSNALGLSALKSRTWSIFKTSATKGEGLDEAMEWWVTLRILLI